MKNVSAKLIFEDGEVKEDLINGPAGGFGSGGSGGVDLG